MNNNNKTLHLFQYKGNIFELSISDDKASCGIAGMQIPPESGPRLEIPGTYQGIPIRYITLRSKKNGQDIQEILLPKEIEEIQFLDKDRDWQFWSPFPALKAITPCQGHPCFESIDGVLKD